MIYANGYKPFQRLPKQFAWANGLANKKCGLIIRDERQRSWDLRLTTYGSQVYMGGRWGEFRAANDIKVGNYIMFEVVSNGEQPVWKFHGMFSDLRNLNHLYTYIHQEIYICV